MDCLEIIQKFYPPDTDVYDLLVDHSMKVAKKSIEIARNASDLKPDLEFIENAALLHDIGIIKTRAESIGCTGDKPYVCHGYLGRQMLDQEGLPAAYGLVCERHTGAGISLENIISNQLPLPQRDMVPKTVEEKIICVADKYFSKSPKKNGKIITTADVVDELEKISPDHAERFMTWARELNL